MPNFLEDVDFASDTLDVGLDFYFVLLQDFYGDLLPRDGVSAYAYFAKRSLPQRLPYYS